MGSRLRQLLAAPLALVFALGLLGQAYGLNGCPRHASAGHAGHGAQAGEHPAAHGTSASPSAAAAPHAAVDGRGGGGDEASPCGCIGSCHLGAAGVHPAAAPGVPAPDPSPEAARRPAPDLPARETPAYFLPYPLGPPAA